MAVRWRPIRCVSAALIVCGLTSCASRRASGLTDRLIVQGEPALNIPGPPAPGRPTLDPALRKQLRDAVPPARDPVPTIERLDAGLAEASAALQAQPTAEHHWRVAEAYRRLHVLDAAYDHFSDALRLDPKAAAAFDGRARVWRDSGFPQAGLADAYRAIAHAPSSAIPYNTLGTLYWSLGDTHAARLAFEQALAHDPAAVYAVRNLCLARLREGDSPTSACLP